MNISSQGYITCDIQKKACYQLFQRRKEQRQVKHLYSSDKDKQGTNKEKKQPKFENKQLKETFNSQQSAHSQEDKQFRLFPQGSWRPFAISLISFGALPGVLTILVGQYLHLDVYANFHYDLQDALVGLKLMLPIFILDFFLMIPDWNGYLQGQHIKSMQDISSKEDQTQNLNDSKNQFLSPNGAMSSVQIQSKGHSKELPTLDKFGNNIKFSESDFYRKWQKLREYRLQKDQKERGRQQPQGQYDLQQVDQSGRTERQSQNLKNLKSDMEQIKDSIRKDRSQKNLDHHRNRMETISNQIIQIIQDRDAEQNKAGIQIDGQPQEPVEKTSIQQPSQKVDNMLRDSIKHDSQDFLNIESEGMVDEKLRDEIKTQFMQQQLIEEKLQELKKLDIKVEQNLTQQESQAEASHGLKQSDQQQTEKQQNVNQQKQQQEGVRERGQDQQSQSSRDTYSSSSQNNNQHSNTSNKKPQQDAQDEIPQSQQLPQIIQVKPMVNSVEDKNIEQGLQQINVPQVQLQNTSKAGTKQIKDSQDDEGIIDLITMFIGDEVEQQQKQQAIQGRNKNLFQGQGSAATSEGTTDSNKDRVIELNEWYAKHSQLVKISQQNKQQLKQQEENNKDRTPRIMVINQNGEQIDMPQETRQLFQQELMDIMWMQRNNSMEQLSPTKKFQMNILKAAARWQQDRLVQQSFIKINMIQEALLSILVMLPSEMIRRGLVLSGGGLWMTDRFYEAGITETDRTIHLFGQMYFLDTQDIAQFTILAAWALAVLSRDTFKFYRHKKNYELLGNVVYNIQQRKVKQNQEQTGKNDVENQSSNIGQDKEQQKVPIKQQIANIFKSKTPKKAISSVKKGYVSNILVLSIDTGREVTEILATGIAYILTNNMFTSFLPIVCGDIIFGSYLRYKKHQQVLKELKLSEKISDQVNKISQEKSQK